MSIEVVCPTCGAKLKAPEAAAGKRAKCGKCRQLVLVPAPAAPAAPASEVAAAAAAPAAEPEPFPTLSESENPFDFGPATPMTPSRSTYPPSEPEAAAGTAFQEPDNQKTRSRPGSRQRQAENTSSTRRYLAPHERRSSNRLLYVSVGLAVVAVLAVIVAFIAYRSNSAGSKTQQASARGPAEPASSPAADDKANTPVPPPTGQEVTATPKNKKGLADAADKQKGQPEKPPKGGTSKSGGSLIPSLTPKGTSSPREILQVPANLKSFKLPAPAKRYRAADKSRHRIELPVPADRIVRFFPPAQPGTSDSFVIARVGPDANAGWEWIQLGPVGNVVARTPLPIASQGDVQFDLQVVKDTPRLVIVSNNRLTVWDATSKSAIVEDIDPLQAAGSAAAKSGEGIAAGYARTDANQIVIVCRSGVVLLYDYDSRKIVQEWVPPRKGTGQLRWHRDTASAGNTFVVATGRTIYALWMQGEKLIVSALEDLGGEVLESHAAGCTTSSEPAMVYAFRAESPRGPTSVLGVMQPAKKLRRFFRWPDDVAVPLTAGSVENTLAILTANGIVLLHLDDEHGGVAPFAFARIDGLPRLWPQSVVPTDDGLWCIVPDASQPERSHAVRYIMPPDDYAAMAQRASEGQSLTDIRITLTALEIEE